MKVDIDLTGKIFCNERNEYLAYPNSRIRGGMTDNLVHLNVLSERNSANNKCNNSLIDESCFYAGNLYNHFGHFLLESLSRLSGYNGESFIVWSSPTGSVRFKSWQVEIFKILGIAESQHVFITNTHSFNDINIVERGYVIWDKFTQSHRKYLATVSDKNQKYVGRKVWLSRVGYQTYENEYIIETILAKHGWLVINPVEISVMEQVSVFNSASEIAGIEGTAFHTVVLAKSPCDNITIFERRGNGFFNENYIRINSALGGGHKLIVPGFEGKKIKLESIWSNLCVDLDEYDLHIIKNLTAHINVSMKALNENKIIDGVRDLAIYYKSRNIELAFKLISVAHSLRPNGRVIKKMYHDYDQAIRE